MKFEEYMQEINNFEEHYNYDSTYMREMLESSLVGYSKFVNAIPLTSHREHLDLETFWVAKLASVKTEDCGECLQLNVNMAKEAGVSAEIIRGVIMQSERLSNDLKDVFDYAVGVSLNQLDNEELLSRIEMRFDKGQLIELGVCISTAKIFPVIKRSIGYAKSCALIELEM